jgi:hypothetical protein
MRAWSAEEMTDDQLVIALKAYLDISRPQTNKRNCIDILAKAHERFTKDTPNALVYDSNINMMVLLLGRRHVTRYNYPMNNAGAMWRS